MKRFLISILISILFISLSSVRIYAKKVVFIDPGHGGYDPGAVIDGVKEASINLEISLELREIFIENGYDVIMSRDSDADLCQDKFIKRVDLNNRAKLINDSNALLCISIHMNSFAVSKYSGAQVFYDDINDKNEDLADSINKSIKALVKNSNRAIVKRDNIYLLKRISIPACIVECGFMTNEEELNNLLDKAYQISIAIAIFNGCKNFL